MPADIGIRITGRYRSRGTARQVPFDEAMALFRDSTGRPGPATWEAGSYPEGEDEFPVTGVSWYEAAAYAAFAGKSLPTIYHWSLVAGPAAERRRSCRAATSQGRGS